MAKDPAFLFYSGDFLNGVADLTMEERGQYITMLCLQHQKGHISDKTIRLMVGSVSVDVLGKFKKDAAGNFFNERLEKIISEREIFLNSRRENGRLGGRPKTKANGYSMVMPKHNLHEDINENEIEDRNGRGVRGETEKVNETGRKLEKFIKPTSADIIAYLLEEGITPPAMEADKFIDFYSSKDWMVGKNKMKDWKAAVRNWFRNIIQIERNKNTNGKINPDTFRADLDRVCA